MPTVKDFSNQWVADHILKYKDIISSIGVGNEWLHEDGAHRVKAKLVPAMQHIYNSLEQRSLHKKIKVSTPHAFDVEGYPPSQGHFKTENVEVMKSILKFLHDKESFFMLNVYPFLAYAGDQNNIDINYALFKETPKKVVDGKLTYTDLFDAMLDTMITAMTKVGYKDMPIVITETGWPNGGSIGRGAEPENARYYNQTVIKHVLNQKGTPLRPHHSFPTYIFAFYNEDKKKGGHLEEEKHWGHYNRDLTEIYHLRMSKT